MPVYTKYYTGIPNAPGVVDPELSFVTILRVSREGDVYQQISTIPVLGKPEFFYNQPNGRIIFGPDRLIGGEKISVTFRV